MAPRRDDEHCQDPACCAPGWLADTDPKSPTRRAIKLGTVYCKVWECSFDGRAWVEVPEVFVVGFKEEIINGRMRVRQVWP